MQEVVQFTYLEGGFHNWKYLIELFSSSTLKGYIPN